MNAAKIVNHFIGIQGKVIEVDGIKIRLSHLQWDQDMSGGGSLKLNFELHEEIKAGTLVIENLDGRERQITQGVIMLGRGA